MVHHSHLLFILAPGLRAVESSYLDFFQNEEQEQQFINAHSFMSAEWGTHGSSTRIISLVTPPLTTQSYEKQAHVHPRSHHSASHGFAPSVRGKSEGRVMRVGLRVTHHSSTLHPSDLRHPTGARVRNVSEDPLSRCTVKFIFPQSNRRVDVVLLRTYSAAPIIPPNFGA